MKSIALLPCTLAGLGLLSVSQLSLADETPIKLGVVTSLDGPYKSFGEESMRGVEVAMKKWANEAGGKKIEYVKGISDSSKGSAVAAAKKLIEEQGAKIIIGPMSSGEGLEFKDLAKQYPKVTFLNGASSAPAVTLNDPAPNFFRFNTDAVQWMTGLGSYAFNEKGYKKVVVIAEDYDFARSQVRGFLQDYCNAGGRVAKSFWVEPKTEDYSEIIKNLPEDYDAVFLPHGGEDALIFLVQYESTHAKDVRRPLLGGSITIDKIFYNTRGERKKYLQGVAASGPVSATYDGKEWKAFHTNYREMFPKGFLSPTLFAHAYYVNTIAALSGLDKVEGELGDGHAKFREALQNLELETPTGIVRLNENRQAVADMYISEVQKGDRKLYKKFIKVVPAVQQVSSVDEDEFAKTGMPGKELPKSCKTGS